MKILYKNKLLDLKSFSHIDQPFKLIHNNIEVLDIQEPKAFDYRIRNFGTLNNGNANIHTRIILISYKMRLCIFNTNWELIRCKCL